MRKMKMISSRKRTENQDTSASLIRLCGYLPGEMKTSEKVYWIKAAFAVLMALASLLVQTNFNLDGSYVFLLGAMVYMGLSDLLAYQLNLERSRALKIGIGVFIFVWITLWTLFNTVLKTMG